MTQRTYLFVLHFNQPKCPVHQKHIHEEMVTVLTTEHAHRRKSRDTKQRGEKGFTDFRSFSHKALLPRPIFVSKLRNRILVYKKYFPDEKLWPLDFSNQLKTRLPLTTLVLELQYTCKPSLLVRNLNYLGFGQRVFYPLIGPQSEKSRIRLRYSLVVRIFYITAKFHIHPSMDKDEESI